MRYQLRYIGKPAGPEGPGRTVRDTGIEPVTSSVSGKRSPAELNARAFPGGKRGADDGTRTRDPHLGKVMRYQLRYIRVPDGHRPPVRARYWDRTSDLFRVREALSR